MKSVRTKAILAASVVGLTGLSAYASPLVYYKLEGRLAGSSGAFSSTVTVSAGTQIETRLMPYFAPTGTVFVNSTTGVASTITGVSGSDDGFNILPKVDIVKVNSSQIDGSFATRAVNSSLPPFLPTATYAGALGIGVWDQNGTVLQQGTPVSTGVQGIKAAAAYGVIQSKTTLDTYGTQYPAYYGAWFDTYTISTVVGSAAQLKIALNTQGSDSGASGFQVHVNGGAAATGFTSDTTTETSANPFYQFVGLNLVTAVSNVAPAFTAGSGLAAGDTVVDATLDVVQPVALNPKSITFSIPDSFITDEAASSVTVGLGTLPTALQGHVTLSGRNIIVTGSLSDYPSLVGTYNIPLTLTDNQSATGSGQFTLSIVPEPTSIGLLGLGGLALLRRRKNK